MGHRGRRAAGAGTLATTSLIAGLFGAPPAHASGDVWQRLAACESSGRWHVNTGNHYYGGLQFWQPTWAGFGGRKYAPRADLATPRQQVEVARRVLAAQGPGAWPYCGKHAGLTRASGRATSAPLPNVGPYVRSVPVARGPAAKPVAPRVARYRVRPGDSLSVIAERFHVRGGWPALWHYNRTNVPNPNVIMIGQLLQIP